MLINFSNYFYSANHLENVDFFAIRIYECSKTKVFWNNISSGYIKHSALDFTAASFSMLAELERDFIFERTKEGLRARVAKGIKFGKPKGVIQASMYDAGKEKIIHLYQLGVPIQKIIATHLGYGKYLSLKAYINKLKRVVCDKAKTYCLRYRLDRSVKYSSGNTGGSVRNSRLVMCPTFRGKIMLKINYILYKTLTENMNGIYGEKGQHWVSTLPIVVDEISTHWELSHISPFDNMTFNFVAKAMRQNNQPIVLKVGYDKNAISCEMQTLKYFNGQAAIQLIDYNADHNALLLQQAMPGISLKSLYPSQLDLVMDCYVKTMLTLHQKSLPKRHDFPHIREWLNAIDQVGKDKLPIDLIDKAIRLKNNLLNSLTHEILLHGDLHLDNVLQDGNEWIVIDPKGIVGDVEFEMAAFDFIYHSELDNKEVTDFYEKSIALISQKSNLNFQRIKDWVFVRLILSAAWSIEDNRDYSWAIQLARLL